MRNTASGTHPNEWKWTVLKLFRRRKRYQYVFIFTYGRSGSTLLMGLLNSLPHYCIRGENNNLLYRLFWASEALHSALASPSAKNASKPTNPWYGLDRTNPDGFAQRLVDAFVDDVLAPEPQHTTIGFKEIRFSQAEVPDFEGYIAFVRRSFPGCRIIFNHRNLGDVAASKWWSTMPAAPQKLQFIEDRFNSLPQSPDILHFHYDRIDESLEHVKELFAFLGEGFDEQAVRQVLAVPHSY